MAGVLQPNDETFARCEARIGYAFADRELLRRALTHGSAKSPAVRSNERFEFLGDSILGAIVSDFLFREYPDMEEGRLTKARAAVVSRRSLSEVARRLELAPFMIVGKMFARPETIADSILSDAVEAVLAAIYLEGGFAAARDFVLRHFEPAIREAASDPGHADYKSLLGQLVQQTWGSTPDYRLESASGPDHDLTFEVTVVVCGRQISRARGPNKKAAEQEGARLALLELKPS
jgi:ribonuclease III